MSLPSFLQIPPNSRRRLKILYHTAFVLLAVHMALVYLVPGFFHNPRGDWAQLLPEQTKARWIESILIEREGKTWLRGGSEPEDHFDISEFHLNPNRLKYGLGRERFPALIEPEFVSAEQADQRLGAEAKVLVVRIGQTVRVYPIDLLTRHEVVNDVVEGVPIFAAYCILADLGAVYDRRLGDHTLTFALSGYTYSDPDVWAGRDAFVLWDRETESLWWPPIGKAVSGPLIDQPLKVLDHDHWAQTTWGKVREKHPDAEVLKPGQDFDPPQNWPGLPEPPRLAIGEGDQTNTGSQAKPASEAGSGPRIAPGWGENDQW